MDILSKPDSHGDTPLSLAVRGRNLMAVQKLLDKKSMGDSVAQDMFRALDSEKTQPLYIAASRGFPEICQILIDHGAPPTDENENTNEYGPIPLDAAFKGWQEWNGDSPSRLQEFEDIINILIPKSGEILGESRKFICATWRGSTSVCKHLVSANNVEDKHGWLPAVISAYFGNRELARDLRIKSNRKLVNELLSGNVPRKPHGHTPSKWSATDKHEAMILSKKRTVASVTNCGRIP